MSADLQSQSKMTAETSADAANGPACLCRGWGLALMIAVVLGAFLFAVSPWSSRTSNERADAAAADQEDQSLAELSAELEQLLTDQAAAWNEGKLEAFMEPYWHSEQLTFSSGGKTTRGWQATLEGYRARYPDQATMGHLTFSQLETIRLDGRAALMLGRWELERESNPIGGNFSLVWQRQTEGWRIVHDHTSSDPKTE